MSPASVLLWAATLLGASHSHAQEASASLTDERREAALTVIADLGTPAKYALQFQNLNYSPTDPEASRLVELGKKGLLELKFDEVASLVDTLVAAQLEKRVALPGAIPMDTIDFHVVHGLDRDLQWSDNLVGDLSLMQTRAVDITYDPEAGSLTFDPPSHSVALLTPQTVFAPLPIAERRRGELSSLEWNWDTTSSGSGHLLATVLEKDGPVHHFSFSNDTIPVPLAARLSNPKRSTWSLGMYKFGQHDGIWAPHTVIQIRGSPAGYYVSRQKFSGYSKGVSKADLALQVGAVRFIQDNTGPKSLVVQSPAELRAEWRQLIVVAPSNDKARR